MIRRITLALVCLLLAPFVAAQTPARYDMPALMTTPAQNPPGSLPPLLAIINATVSVCGYPASLTAGMCTNTVTTYTDSTLSTSCPSTAQLTAPGTNVCIPTTGLQGTFGFWYNAATQTHLTYTVQTSWGTFGPYDILQSGGGGGSGTVTSVSALSPLFTTNTPTTTPTFVLSTQSANTVFAGPSSGSASAPTFRALVSADIPNNAASTTGNAETATNLASYPTLCSGGQFSEGLSSGSNNCATPTGAVSSVSNSDGTLTISPTTGSVIASLALGHANTWSALQTYSAGVNLSGSTSPLELAGSAGTSGQCPISGGAGVTPAWGSCGGGGTPGGSSGNLQYNNSGSFGGDADTNDDGAGNITVTSLTTTGSSFQIKAPAIAAPTGVSLYGLLWFDNVADRWKMNNNNAVATNVIGASDLGTSSTPGIVQCGTGTSCSGGVLNVTASGGALTQIAQTVVSGSSTTTITFSSIPGTYTTLKLVFNGASSSGTDPDQLDINFNGDTSTDYDTQGMYANGGSSPAAYASPDVSGLNAGPVTDVSDQQTQIECTVGIYTSTSFYKTVPCANFGNNASSTYGTQFANGVWHGTPAAITSIVLKLNSGAHFLAGTTATLYGEQ